MSRAGLRSQLSSYLQNATSIPDLNQVFTSFPKQINFQVGAQAGQKSRVAVVIFIERESETRIALGGATSGKKRIDYDVVLQVFHHSMQNNAEDAMDDLDATIDALKDYLRADHRFGDTSGNIIWQGAEPAIDVEYSEPSTSDRGATETWVVLRFQVTQIYTA
jgi:hypothetical protein